MRENDNEEQGADAILTLQASCSRSSLGMSLSENSRGVRRYFSYRRRLSLGDGVQASLGFELDGDDGVLGKPVFLHRRMQIRHLGNLEDYCADPFVRSLLPRVVPLLDPALGTLPVIAVIEALRIDPAPTSPPSLPRCLSVGRLCGPLQPGGRDCLVHSVCNL